jgi:hypothetical protein
VRLRAACREALFRAEIRPVGPLCGRTEPAAPDNSTRSALETSIILTIFGSLCLTQALRARIVRRCHRAKPTIANPCHFEIDANYRFATLPDVHTLSYTDVLTWIIASHLREKFPQKTCRKNAMRQSCGPNPRCCEKKVILQKKGGGSFMRRGGSFNGRCLIPRKSRRKRKRNSAEA